MSQSLLLLSYNIQFYLTILEFIANNVSITISIISPSINGHKLTKVPRSRIFEGLDIGIYRFTR